MGVHGIEVAGEQGRLVAAGAGADFQMTLSNCSDGSSSRKSSSRCCKASRRPRSVASSSSA